MEHLIVSYDIPVDRRRNKVAKTMLGFGERVQYSVFECVLTPERVQEMKAALVQLLDRDEDSVLIYRLCGRCAEQVERIGRSAPPPEGHTFVIN